MLNNTSIDKYMQRTNRPKPVQPIHLACAVHLLLVTAQGSKAFQRPRRLLPLRPLENLPKANYRKSNVNAIRNKPIAKILFKVKNTIPAQHCVRTDLAYQEGSWLGQRICSRPEDHQVLQEGRQNNRKRLERLVTDLDIGSKRKQAREYDTD